MAITFPASPSNGQIYTPGSPAPSYIYVAAKGVWQVNASPTSPSTAVLLTGLSTASAAAVTASDTVLSGIGKLQGQDDLSAPLASPALTGTPTAPTATAGSSSTQIANTAFVTTALSNELGTVAPVMNGTAASGVSGLAAHQDHVHPTDTSRGADTGRNKLRNPLFNISQRGAGPWTTNGVYTTDGWLTWSNGGSISLAVVLLTDPDRTAIGDEEAVFGFRSTFTGGALAANFCRIQQPIENVRRTSGATVTVSFWAKTIAGTLKLGVMLDQQFGTGGSAEAPVAGTAVTVTSTWARYSVTGSFASAAGKTIGAGSAGIVSIWFSSGSQDNTFAGGIGVQSGTITLWGMQCEFGNVMTALEKPDPRVDLSNCQRYYQTGGGAGQVYTSTTTNYFKVDLVATMASAPTNAFAGTSVAFNGGSNWTQAGTAPTATGPAVLTGTLSVTAVPAQANFNYGYTASCEI